MDTHVTLMALTLSTHNARLTHVMALTLSTHTVLVHTRTLYTVMSTTVFLRIHAALQ